MFFCCIPLFKPIICGLRRADTRDEFTKLLRMGHVLEDTSPLFDIGGESNNQQPVFDADTAWLHNGTLYVKPFNHRVQMTAMLFV